MVRLGDAVRLETYGMKAVPPGVRALFDRQTRPEGGWDWFEILAATTLASQESACIAVLVDGAGHAVAAVAGVTAGRGGGGDWFEILAAPTLASQESACIAVLVDGAGHAVSAVPVVTAGGRVI